METLLRNDSWNPFRGESLGLVKSAFLPFVKLSYPGFDGMPLYILEVQS